jgi:lantibiotic transport system permease protein
MIRELLSAVAVEWLKRKRSAVLWLVVLAACFVPAIILAARLRPATPLAAIHASTKYWQTLWNTSWEATAILILPLLITLIASLLAQIEFRNNAWKQLNASPLPAQTVWLAKLIVLLIIVTLFFVAINVAMICVAIMPSMLHGNVVFPLAPIPWHTFFERSASYFFSAMPIVLLQFSLSLLFRNFAVPIGLGGAIWVFSIGTLSWEHAYLLPFSHLPLDYLIGTGSMPTRQFPVEMAVVTSVYIAFFATVGFLAFKYRSDRG